MAVHTGIGYTPLHQAVNHGVPCISPTLAATSDRKSWTSWLYCDTLDLSQARSRHQAVLWMGILRALWDHQASVTDSRLILDIPDFSLEQFLRACPASFSSEITKWLHESVTMLVSSSISPTSLHARCAPPLTVARMTPMTSAPRMSYRLQRTTRTVPNHYRFELEAHPICSLSGRPSHLSRKLE